MSSSLVTVQCRIAVVIVSALLSDATYPRDISPSTSLSSDDPVTSSSLSPRNSSPTAADIASGIVDRQTSFSNSPSRRAADRKMLGTISSSDVVGNGPTLSGRTSKRDAGHDEFMAARDGNVVEIGRGISEQQNADVRVKSESNSDTAGTDQLKMKASNRRGRKAVSAAFGGRSNTYNYRSGVQAGKAKHRMLDMMGLTVRKPSRTKARQVRSFTADNDVMASVSGRQQIATKVEEFDQEHEHQSTEDHVVMMWPSRKRVQKRFATSSSLPAMTSNARNGFRMFVSRIDGDITPTSSARSNDQPTNYVAGASEQRNPDNSINEINLRYPLLLAFNTQQLLHYSNPDYQSSHTTDVTNGKLSHEIERRRVKISASGVEIRSGSGSNADGSDYIYPVRHRWSTYFLGKRREAADIDDVSDKNLESSAVDRLKQTI